MWPEMTLNLIICSIQTGTLAACRCPPSVPRSPLSQAHLRAQSAQSASSSRHQPEKLLRVRTAASEMLFITPKVCWHAYSGPLLLCALMSEHFICIMICSMCAGAAHPALQAAGKDAVSAALHAHSSQHRLQRSGAQGHPGAGSGSHRVHRQIRCQGADQARIQCGCLCEREERSRWESRHGGH